MVYKIELFFTIVQSKGMFVLNSRSEVIFNNRDKTAWRPEVDRVNLPCYPVVKPRRYPLRDTVGPSKRKRSVSPDIQRPPVDVPVKRQRTVKQMREAAQVSVLESPPAPLVPPVTMYTLLNYSLQQQCDAAGFILTPEQAAPSMHYQVSHAAEQPVIELDSTESDELLSSPADDLLSIIERLD